MNRDHAPCGMCNRFPPASAKEEGVERTGHCSGWDKQVLSTGQPCVLFLDRGAWQTRQLEQAVSRDQFPRDRKAGSTRPAPGNRDHFARTRTTAAPI